MLCEELKAAFGAEAIQTGKDPLLVTAAVAAGYSTVETAYDIPRIASALDYIHLMSYDLHGGWDAKIGHHSQYYGHSTDESNKLNTNYALNLWIDGGCPPEKMVFGMPAYGRGFTTVGSANSNSIGQTSGVISHSCIMTHKL